MRKAELNGVLLWETGLHEVDLRGAKLYYAELQGIITDKADLRGARLMMANLPEARFVKVHLRGTHFGGANLSRAGLSEVNIHGAILAGAKLVNTRNLTVAQLAKARTLYESQLNSQLMEQGMGSGLAGLLPKSPFVL